MDALKPHRSKSLAKRNKILRGKGYIRMRDFSNEPLTSSVSVTSYFPKGENEVLLVLICKHAICFLITLHMVVIQA